MDGSTIRAGTAAGDSSVAPWAVISPGADGPDFERGKDGIWRYRGTNVAVPAAEDVTLGDLVAARQVVRPGEEPEGVLLSLSELEADERLNWALQAGTRLSGEHDQFYLVPWPVWQERASEPVDVAAPEREEHGVGRQLTVPERDIRLLRHEVELAALRRSRAVTIAAALGLTRRQIGDLLGITPTRVQQLLDDVTAATRADVERFLADGAVVLVQIAASGTAREELSLPNDGIDALDAVLDELIAWGLAVEDADSTTLFPGEHGAALIELAQAGTTAQAGDRR